MLSIIVFSLVAFSKASAQDTNVTIGLSFEFDLVYFNQNQRLKVRMTITFPDDSEDTALMEYHNPMGLMAEETDELVDHCMFKGHLVEEKVPISMVGCPDENQQEVVLNSRKLEEDMFIVINGTVSTPIFKEEGVGVEVDDYPEKRSVRDLGKANLKSQGFKPLPKYMIWNVSLDIDTEYANWQGKNAYNEIRRVLMMAQSFLELHSLGVKIKINVATNCGYMNFKLNAAKREHMKKAQSFIAKNNKFAHSYFILSYRNSYNHLGMSATIGSVCSIEKIDRVSIIEHYGNTIYAARTFAQHFGYHFGMFPDYLVRRGVKVSSPPRYDHFAVSCTNKYGFMDNAVSRSKVWTTCSVQDATTYYNHVIGSTGSFCVPDCTEDIGPGCEFWKMKGICEVPKFAQFCGKTCDYCSKFFPVS